MMHYFMMSQCAVCVCVCGRLHLYLFVYLYSTTALLILTKDQIPLTKHRVATVARSL